MVSQRYVFSTHDVSVVVLTLVSNWSSTPSLPKLILDKTDLVERELCTTRYRRLSTTSTVSPCLDTNTQSCNTMLASHSNTMALTTRHNHSPRAMGPTPLASLPKFSARVPPPLRQLVPAAAKTTCRAPCLPRTRMVTLNNNTPLVSQPFLRLLNSPTPVHPPTSTSLTGTTLNSGRAFPNNTNSPLRSHRYSPTVWLTQPAMLANTIINTWVIPRITHSILEG